MMKKALIQFNKMIWGVTEVIGYNVRWEGSYLCFDIGDDDATVLGMYIKDVKRI